MVIFHSFLYVYQAGYLATIGKDIEMDYAPLEINTRGVGGSNPLDPCLQRQNLFSTSIFRKKNELEKRQLAEFSRVPSGSTFQAERLDQRFRS